MTDKADDLDVEGIEHDELTGLFNRRYISEKIEKMTANRSNKFSLIFLDIDNFSKFNNKYGRLAGDRVLIEVARIINTSLKFGDAGVLWEGDQYAIFLNGVGDLDIAADRADSIRQLIEKERFKINQDRVNYTVSVGVGVWDGKEKAVGLFDRVDNALFTAKNSNRRNSVVPSVR